MKGCPACGSSRVYLLNKVKTLAAVYRRKRCLTCGRFWKEKLRDRVRRRRSRAR